MCWTSDFNNVAVGAAAILTTGSAIFTAWWAYNKYGKERENATKLKIELTVKEYEIASEKRLYLDALLINKGKVKIETLSRFLNGKLKEFVHDDPKDKNEKIRYPLELQIKKLKGDTLWYDWFDKNQYDAIIGFEEINLLKDLEVLDDPTHPGFFIEPGESYHFGCWVSLTKGFYEAKVIYLGSDQPDEFWHGRFPFIVK
jgi:hypothetical protein